MIHDNDIYRIGTLTKTHGVNGELNFAFTDDSWDQVEADHLIVKVDGLFVPFFIEEYRFRNDATAIMKFEDVDNEGEARLLAGAEIYLERALLTDGIKPQYTWDDFIGLTVVIPESYHYQCGENSDYHPQSDATANVIGTITGIDDSTENVLFTITTPNATEHLVPAAEDLIEDIDWDARTITMTIPEGLLEL